MVCLEAQMDEFNTNQQVLKFNNNGCLPKLTKDDKSNEKLDSQRHQVHHNGDAGLAEEHGGRPHHAIECPRS